MASVVASTKDQGGDTLIFDMEILKIKGGKVPALRCDADTKEECNEKEKKYIDKKITSQAIAFRRRM